MTNKKELENLYRNYNELEDDNQKKLLLVGKRLLEVKRLIMKEDNVSNLKGNKLKFENENHT
jgi:hypothetical protein